MTTEDRLNRIENALIAAGLIIPEASPTEEEAIADLKKGDTTKLRAFLLRKCREERRAR
jgi:hypothetical protein